MRARWTLAVALAAVWAVPIGVALAGKPSGGGGGGGGGGSVDTGTVYFRTQGLTWTMNPDGSGKAALPAGAAGEPSHDLHGGRRWFLYRSGEIFAVRDDGAGAVQLTTSAGLTPPLSIRWAPDDSAISWVGDGGAGQRGVYTAATVFDGVGKLTGLASQPASPAVSLSGAEAHDWAPDGVRVVMGDASGALWIASVATGAATRLPTPKPARGPVWSPDGSRIAYADGSVWTIAPDGSGAKEILKKHSGPANYVGSPGWSPAGTHLVCQKGGSILGDDRHDVYRATSTGSGATSLTDDLDTRSQSGSPAEPVGWR